MGAPPSAVLNMITPPDFSRCQARVTTKGPFGLGGPVGDPKDGYRRRCDAFPTHLVTEREPGDDGQMGAMTMCDDCLKVFYRQVPNAKTGYKIEKIDDCKNA